MNNSYFTNGTNVFRANGQNGMNQNTIINPTTPPKNVNYQEMALPPEQSYIENILRLNKGKQVRIHQTFPDSNEWRDMEFKGIIEQSGRDHIIISDPSTGLWEVLLMIYVDYISFDEPINYSAEFYPNN